MAGLAKTLNEMVKAMFPTLQQLFNQIVESEESVRHPEIKLNIPPKMFCMSWCPEIEFRVTQEEAYELQKKVAQIFWCAVPPWLRTMRLTVCA